MLKKEEKKTKVTPLSLENKAGGFLVASNNGNRIAFLDILYKLAVCLAAITEGENAGGSTEGKLLHEWVSLEQLSLFN